MDFTENEFRDFLFENHRKDLSKLVVGKREPISWEKKEFPPIHILLQQRAEKKINSILDDLESLVLSAKELSLNKTGYSTTRVDLYGNSESMCSTIIELKKSKQTERQAFTELLAYSNHFCTIFPGLLENTITSVLIAPMESRTVQDAYVQELVANKKNILALIPEEIDGTIQLKVYYPDSSYYRWFENNLFDDRSMVTVAVSFQVIDGFIDVDIKTNDKKIPDYSKRALDTISNSISHKLEAVGIHGMVYSSQKWGEIAETHPFPNTVFVIAINPFSSFRTKIDSDNVTGESNSGRLEDIQFIYNQISEDEKGFWLETLESNFHGNLIQIVNDEFDQCFLNKDGIKVKKNISLPDWYGIKINPLESAFTHNLDIYLTGLLREIYLEYFRYVYESNVKYCHFYSDDIPMFSYKTLRDFLPVWEILRALGFGNQHE